MKKIGILGRGTMAVGIAQIFAQKDNEVTMWVRTIDKDNPRASLSSLEKGLDKLVKRERMTAEDMEKILKKVAFIHVLLMSRQWKGCLVY